MKAHTRPDQGLLSRLPLARTMSLGIIAAGMLAPAKAVNVDSELVLLVDATQAGLTTNQFNRLMDGYTSVFSGTQILDSIQAGAYGKIAVSLMFFGNSNSFDVGIPWMEISNSTQALQFANLLQTVNRPTYTGASNVAAALTSAAFTFGTETGGTANGFESEVQTLEILASRVPTASAAAATTAASNVVLAAGVDMINSVAVGGQASAIDAFYTANVIGSTIPGAPPSSSTSTLNATTLAGNLNTAINNTVQTGATTSMVTAVPEPDTSLALAAGVLLLIRRRRI